MIYVRNALTVLWLFVSCFLGLLLGICELIWMGRRDLELNYTTGRIYTWGALRIAGVELEISGAEHLDGHTPCVFVGNHQSMLDVAVFGGMLPPKSLAIGKKELVWVPFFGPYLWVAGNVLIKRQDRSHAVSGLETAAATMRDHSASIFVFPEGTRNRTSEPMLPFKKGAFHVAISAGRPVVPMVCSLQKPLYDWKTGVSRRGKLQVRVLPPVDSSAYDRSRVNQFALDVRERMVEAFLGLETRVTGSTRP